MRCIHGDTEHTSSVSENTMAEMKSEARAGQNLPSPVRLSSGFSVVIVIRMVQSKSLTKKIPGKWVCIAAKIKGNTQRRVMSNGKER